MVRPDDRTSPPIVYNTSGYERIETLDRYAGLAPIYLTDLRYASARTAAEASDAPDYVEVARAALLEMRRQTGPWQMDSDAIAQSGTLCRILVLPGHADEAMASLRWLADNTDGVAVSVMRQYVPAHKAFDRTPWGRRITDAEYETVCACFEDLGFEIGWIQVEGSETNDDLIGFNMGPGNGARGNAIPA